MISLFRVVVLGLFLFVAGCANMGDLSISQIKEKIDASNKIGKTAQTKPVDFAALNKIYSKDLQPLVKSLDKEFNSGMDNGITTAISNGKANKEPAYEVQVVMKTLTRVFYLALVRSLEKGEIEKALAYNEAAKVPAQRRDKTVKPCPNLEATLTTAFSALEQASKTGNKMDIMLQKKIIIDTLKKSYALSVLFEVEELIKNREKDPEFVKVKVAEGLTYYKILENDIKNNSPKSNEIIMSMFSGPASNYDLKVLREELNKGLGGDIQLK
ncbi:MAG: hypothetical protein A3J83_00880 [Elusimicrobia bacterium RIFOXYA2_FULL_40_6]|nr:MAG: hypothetical protein A3J83_00880 [Elusimicrobia bacterium RIFOXYA2_FULL_40_6]